MLPFIPIEYVFVKEIADAQIERFVAQLGSESYRERETATKALAAIGEPALKRLRKAASESEDLEVRARATAIIAPIERDSLRRRIRKILGSDLDDAEKSKQLKEIASAEIVDEVLVAKVKEAIERKIAIGEIERFVGKKARIITAEEGRGRFPRHYQLDEKASEIKWLGDVKARAYWFLLVESENPKMVGIAWTADNEPKFFMGEVFPP